MKALALTAAGHIEIIEVDEPVVGPTAALVAVECSGVCGTDLKIVDGELPVSFPRVLGHEVVGRVLRSADEGNLAVGTRVLVDPFQSCHRCRECGRSLHHLCRRGSLIGRDVDGGLTELIGVEESRLVAIPPSIDDDWAPLLQVLGTCVHAQDRIAASADDVALVIGLGVSGLLHVQLLRERGVATILGTARSASKRQLAEQFGATATAPPDDLEEIVRVHTGGRGADIVVECVGSGATLQQAVTHAAPAGHVLAYGITARPAALELYPLYFRELTIVGTRAARLADYQRGVDLAASHRIDLSGLLEASFALDAAVDAIAAARVPGSLKIAVTVG